MSLECKSLLDVIQDRALMFEKLREFFKRLDILEVDTPILSKYPCFNTHISLMETYFTFSIKGYLHSSPEHGMKKLLCKLKKDIYQISHVFRQHELGFLHRPEFTIIEWYLVNKDLQNLLAQTLDLIQLFISFDRVEQKSYEEIFYDTLHFNPFHLTDEKLFSLASSHGFKTQDQDAALSFLWDIIEKTLGQNCPCVITDFPGDSSQLSKTFIKNQRKYAARFEIYYKGIELANGYDELLDPIEHRKRFEEVIKEKTALGQKKLPLDETFLNILEKTKLPQCTGVAVGFDRLMMLRHNTHNIDDILPLSWDET